MSSIAVEMTDDTPAWAQRGSADADGTPALSASWARQSRRFRSIVSSAIPSIAHATANNVTAIGRVKNIVQLPFDMISD